MEIKSEASRPKEWVRGAIIGAGAFGTVSLAMDKSNGELFAVKSMAANSISCLENEYNILKCLNSPHIVKCLGRDCSVENGVEVSNLLMEYMHGGSVADLLTAFGGRLEESVIRGFTRGILRGLDYLHRQGIVHCDVKGKNVLVGAGGMVKLGDFGSARRREDKGLRVKDLRGTPLWMAPEVVNQVEQGPPSDIWSAGCTVVEMATGRPPWSDVSNPLAAMYRIGRTGQLPDLPPCLSPHGRDFLEKCFRRDPNQRWTAAQLLNHPFLAEDSLCSAREAKRAPLSPTSTLDFGRPDWDSSSSSMSQTLPILSLNIARSASRDRLAALAANGERPDWCASPPTSKWIVVRCSSPLFNSPPTKKRSAEEENNNSSLEDNDGENKQFVNERSIVEASRHRIRYEIRLHPMPRTAPSVVDQTQELCEISSNHLDPEIHDRAEVRENDCISAAKTRQIWRLCCVLFVEQDCPKMFMKGRLCISLTADTPVCNITSELIPIHVVWVHNRVLLSDDLTSNALFV